MAPATEKVRGGGAKDSAPTYLLHSDLHLAIHLLSMEILGPVKEREKSLSQDTVCFTLFSLLPKALLPEVHVQTHCLPNSSLLDCWFSQYLCVLCARMGGVGMGEVCWTRGLEIQVLVLSSCLTSILSSLKGRNKYLHDIFLRVILRIK